MKNADVLKDTSHDHTMTTSKIRMRWANFWSRRAKVIEARHLCVKWWNGIFLRAAKLALFRQLLTYSGAPSSEVRPSQNIFELGAPIGAAGARVARSRSCGSALSALVVWWLVILSRIKTNNSLLEQAWSI